MASGTMLARACLRASYHVFTYNEYPSLIRGGHNVVTVKIAAHKFYSLTKDVDVLIALNKETVAIHEKELQKDSRIIYDPEDYADGTGSFPHGVHKVPVPMTQIVSDEKGDTVMRNTVALGAMTALLGLDFASIGEVISSQFYKKGEETVKHNTGIAKAGYEYVRKNYPEESQYVLSKTSRKEISLLLGASEAIGIGAVRSGMKFAAIYPMTPINAVITFLAQFKDKYGIVYKQPEDEIAGINMAIGTSIAGVRSMVATSGGGFALMEEGLAFAGIAEVPLVIDLGMRVGPASGMPTWSEQGELRFAIHAGHGEFLRVVLAPGDAGEAYEAAIQAFQLADKYQIPVFILTDKYLNESQFCEDLKYFQQKVKLYRGKLISASDLQNTKDFKRYSLDTRDGVSFRSLPGMKNGHYNANSYEHDEYGFSTEDPHVRTDMVNKRAKKIISIQKDVRPPAVYGDNDSDITIVSWGSTKGVILEALKMMKEKNIKVRFLHYTWVYPFPKEATIELLRGTKRIIDIENNSTAQFASLLAEHTGIELNEKILKYDGRPFYPEEIVDKIKD